MAYSFEEGASMLQIITILLWAMLSSTKTKHANFDKVFMDVMSVEAMLSVVTISFAPGLFSVLKNAMPPKIAFFKSLPSMTDNVSSAFALYSGLQLYSDLLPPFERLLTQP